MLCCVVAWDRIHRNLSRWYSLQVLGITGCSLTAIYHYTERIAHWLFCEQNMRIERITDNDSIWCINVDHTRNTIGIAVFQGCGTICQHQSSTSDLIVIRISLIVANEINPERIDVIAPENSRGFIPV